MAWLTLTRMTFADTVRQPVTWLMTTLSVVLIGLSYGFGLFNFLAQDRLHMLATSGVAIGTINGLFLAVVLASQTVHDELSSRTALTLFAKPVSRGGFLVGKTLGVWATVAASSAAVALVHVSVLAYAMHSGYDDGLDDDARASDDALHLPWRAIWAAHALGLGHSAVLASIAAVLALRLGLVTNILLSFGLFLAGNLLPACGIMGLLAIPALSIFNIDDAIQLGLPVSGGYLAMTALYTAGICAGWLCIGLAVFERQDIP